MPSLLCWMLGWITGSTELTTSWAPHHWREALPLRPSKRMTPWFKFKRPTKVKDGNQLKVKLPLMKITLDNILSKTPKGSHPVQQRQILEEYPSKVIGGLQWKMNNTVSRRLEIILDTLRTFWSTHSLELTTWVEPPPTASSSLKPRHSNTFVRLNKMRVNR
jgi:hypothetical protein